MSGLVTYPSTDPQFHDTEKYSLDKILQALNGGAGGGGPVVDGDVLTATILASGERAELLIKGKATGGTYDFGLGPDPETDPVPDAAKVVFTVTSKGFDDAGVATTNVRTVHATKFVRKVTPDEDDADETVSGSDVIIRVWLSDYIYAKDKAGVGNSGVNVTVTIAAGLYTQGGASNASDPTVTNNSAAAYQQPIANHSTTPYRRHVGNVTGGVVAFERHGQQKRPVRAVKVTVTDEGAHSVSQIITNPTIDAGAGDAKKVIEFQYSIAQTTFTQGNKLTINFIAYPWVGDVVLDSSDAVNAVLSPNYCPQEHLCDKGGTYGVTVALVDPTGDDAGVNTVYDEAVFDPLTAYKFLTIGKAAAAIAAYNNTNRSRNDVGGGIVYLNAGSYAWLGSTNTYGTTPKTWITITPTTGVARSDVMIATKALNSDISDRIRVKNIKITVTTVNVFDSTIATWLEGCEFDTTNTGLLNTTAGRFWVTQCKVTRLNQGLKPVGGVNCAPVLVRGNDLTGFAHQILCYTVIGNSKTTTYAPSATLLVTEINGMVAPQPKGWIIAFNGIYGWRTDFQLLESGRYVGPQTHGGAIVQNVFENAVNGLAQALADVSSSDDITTNTPVNNILIWHNTWLGQRCFIGYNDVGTIVKERLFWSQINNYWDRWASKTDTHPTANAARVGNWAVVNSVGASGNQLAQNMISIPGSFYAEFCGLNCHQPDGSSSETAAYPLFVDAKRYDGTTNGAGDGDYHLQALSPLKAYPVRAVLPFDLNGDARAIGTTDSTGAFA